jgi:hypothetical protein
LEVAREASSLRSEARAGISCRSENARNRRAYECRRHASYGAPALLVSI